MLKLNVTFDHRPEKVKVEALPDGVTRIALYDNIREETITEEETTYTVFKADEVVFIIHEPISVESVTEDFEAWWEFGSVNDSDTAEISTEERINALEEMVAELMFGGV